MTWSNFALNEPSVSVVECLSVEGSTYKWREENCALSKPFFCTKGKHRGHHMYH